MHNKTRPNLDKLLQKTSNNQNLQPFGPNDKFKNKPVFTIDQANKENYAINIVKQITQPNKTKIIKGHERYLSNIYAHLKSTYQKNLSAFDPFDHQPSINRRMRNILFNWLLEVHFKYNLKIRTIFLTANIFERYLQYKRIEREQLQLVGITCLLIASKYEDIYPPELRDLYHLCEKTYTIQNFLDCENDILLHLNFDFVFVSALDVSELKTKLLNEEDKHIEEVTQVLLHIFLFNSNMSRLDAFKLSDFVRYYSCRLIKGHCHDIGQLSLDELEAYTLILKKLLDAIRLDKLYALQSKYKSSFLSS